MPYGTHTNNIGTVSKEKSDPRNRDSDIKSNSYRQRDRAHLAVKAKGRKKKGGKTQFSKCRRLTTPGPIGRTVFIVKRAWLAELSRHLPSQQPSASL